MLARLGIRQKLALLLAVLLNPAHKHADLVLAIDAIDRMPRFSVTGSGVREALLNEQIACKNHAYEFGIDREDITNWKWPF